jgi:hypothetical protein
MWEKIGFVVFGAVIGWFLQQYRVARSEDISLVNEHIKDIEKFCEAAQAYWLKTPSTKEEDVALAAKVRATHSATTLLYPDIGRICENRRSEYEFLTFDLFNAATGGQFEGSHRELDAPRAIDIGDASARLVHLLRSNRVYIVSMKRFWKSLKNRSQFRSFGTGKDHF